MAQFLTLAFALRYLQPCLAMPWLGPMETPVGLMATAGISPRPTQAPGLAGVPKELKPRQQALRYPPPNEWCGLVEGLASESRPIRRFVNHPDTGVQMTSSPAAWVSPVSIEAMLSAAVRA